jgi:hypothetical protein
MRKDDWSTNERSGVGVVPLGAPGVICGANIGGIFLRRTQHGLSVEARESSPIHLHYKLRH